MVPAKLLRAVRHTRRLSQRELAQVAGVPRSTVDRIESGRSSQPSLDVIERILEAAGYHLIVVSSCGQLLDVDKDRGQVEDRDQLYGRGQLRDRGGRHFPAHLKLYRLRSMQEPWWGWYRIAWNERDPKVPTWVYYHRWKPPWSPVLGDRRWNDAT